jgi:hypothetical protein
LLVIEWLGQRNDLRVEDILAIIAARQVASERGGSHANLFFVVNRSLTDAAQPWNEGRNCDATTHIGGRQGLCSSLVVKFWSAMVLTSQESDY